eukprot:sb/3468946/
MIALESHSSAVYDVFLFQVATEVVPVQTELPVTTNTVKDRDSDELPLDLPAQPVATEVVPVQTESPVTTNTVKDRDSDELPLDLPAQPVATEVVTEVSKLNNVTSQQLTGQRHPLEPPFPQPRSSSRQHQQKTFYNKLTQTSKQMYKKQSVIPDSMVLPHANGADVIFCGRFIHFTTELPGLETPVSEEVVYGGGRTSLKRKSSFRRKSRQNHSAGKRPGPNPPSPQPSQGGGIQLCGGDMSQ